MNDAAEALRSWEGCSIEHWRESWGLPQLLVFRRVGSTNDIARALAEADAPAGTTVIADEQTTGRGRQGRRWHAPAGKALLMSIVLRPPKRPVPVPATLPLRVGLAVARTIEKLAGIRVGIEWPNDVLVGGRKVAGVLCEAALTGSMPSFVVAGVGLNVALEAVDFADDEVRARATSLLLATGRRLERPALAGTLLHELLHVTAADAGALRGEIARQLATRDALRGRLVLDPTERPLGVGEGIDPDGALRVRTPDGRLQRTRTGSVRVGPPTAAQP